MAVGMMLTFLDFRNDVRHLIDALSKRKDIVLFIRPEHVHLAAKFKASGYSYRVINESNGSIRNFLATRIFLLFRRLPASKINYYLMEAFKAQGLPNPKHQQKAKRILFWQRCLPKFLSYDTYLKWLAPSCNTDLTGIESMLAFTEIYDDQLMSRLIKHHIPTSVYVYSWDHACKHVRFSDQVNYMVWHQGIAEDLITLQHISPQQITSVGATQLGFIERYRRSTSAFTSPKRNQFYYACGVGIKSLVAEEVGIITTLATIIQRELPDHILIVRPYPNLQDWSAYDILEQYPNIRIENSYKQQDLSVSDEDILAKFTSIGESRALFHTGTTLGLEACFIGCPSFILDLQQDNGNDVCLYHFVHQYQNEKYLISQGSNNTIRDEAALAKVLHTYGDYKYQDLSRTIQDLFTVHSFDQLADNIIDILP